MLGLPAHCWLSFWGWWWQQVIPGEIGSQFVHFQLLQDINAALSSALGCSQE